MATHQAQPALLVSRSAIRSFAGRLNSTPAIRVTLGPSASMGGTKGDEAKLAKVYPADIARALREVGGASVKWETIEPPPGRDDVLRGYLAVPSVPTMLKYGFAHWDAQRADTTFPADVRFTVIDTHNDQAMAWLVLDADGMASIRAAARGEEKNARVVASTLDEYLFRAFDAGCLAYWHDPARDPGALTSFRSLPLVADANAEIIASDAIDAAQVKSWIKEAVAAETQTTLVKDIKVRAKTLPSASEGGMRLVRVRIEMQTPGFFANGAVAALADAPGAETLLAACAPSDPRFDRSWGVPGLDAPMPAGIIAVRHHEAPGATTVNVEILLASALVPQGVVVGARYATVCSPNS